MITCVFFNGYTGPKIWGGEGLGLFVCVCVYVYVCLSVCACMDGLGEGGWV